MRNILIGIATLALVLVAGAKSASAGGSPKSFGVGAEYMLGGPGGISLNYDFGDFHAGGFFGFANNDFVFFGGEESDLDLGGRFYYHVHSTAMSDFGVGGTIGFRSINNPDPMEDFTGLYFDLGAQIRMFFVSNVALSASLGLVIGTSDADGVALGGDFVGGMGIHYYFF